jgi:hypothetical protein
MTIVGLRLTQMDWNVDANETNLTKGTEMNIIEAVKAAKETGCEIRRATWATSVKLYISSGSFLCYAINRMFQPHVDDLLADDWEIVADPPKEIHLMGFVEAMAKVKTGYAVKRKHWVHAAVEKSGVGILRRSKEKDNKLVYRHFIPEFADIEATDWVVVEEGNNG